MQRYVKIDFLCSQCEKNYKKHHAKGLCLDCYSAKHYKNKASKQSEQKDLSTAITRQDSTEDVE